VDVGLPLPKDLIARLFQVKTQELTAYVWGESLIRNRAMVGAILEKQVREMAGQKPPAEIVAVPLQKVKG